jgi:hypothetical protein
MFQNYTEFLQMKAKKIAETWNEMLGMGMKESDFLDYNYFNNYRANY